MNHFGRSIVVACFVFALVSISFVRAQEHQHAKETDQQTVKGEVIDMACYMDHGAMGEKHADCAKTCISGGLPVGLRTTDGKVYLLIGEHKTLNADLAPLAAKTISVKGKVVSRDGINMIENAEIMK